MARSHKFAGTGFGVDTALSVDDLRSICFAAAPQATGTMWAGQQKIQLEHDGGDVLQFTMKAALFNITRFTFRIAITERAGRRQILSTIVYYMTTQTVVLGFVPVGPRTMVGHNVYVEFLQLVAQTIRDADPTAATQLALGADQRATVPAVTSAVPSQQPAGQIPTTLAQDFVSHPSESPVSVLESQPEPTPEPEVAPEQALTGDRTVVVERRAAQLTWTLLAVDGTQVELAARTVLGRDPKAIGVGDFTAVVGADDATVSASHAVVEVNGSRLFVTDLDSTNGTVIVDANGEEQVCPAGRPVEVMDGSAVELGAYTLGARLLRRRIR